MQIMKSLFAGAIAVLVNIVSACQSQKPESYIGFQYATKEELKGLEFVGGSIIFGGGAVKNMQGGYTQVRQGDKNMLWLMGQQKQTDKGLPVWQVLDVLSFSEYDQQLNNKAYFLGWGGRCKAESRSFREDVIAIFVLENKLALKDIKKAWKINRKTGKFEPHSNQNIICQNPHIG